MAQNINDEVNSKKDDSKEAPQDANIKNESKNNNNKSEGVFTKFFRWLGSLFGGGSSEIIAIKEIPINKPDENINTTNTDKLTNLANDSESVEATKTATNDQYIDIARGLRSQEMQKFMDARSKELAVARKKRAEEMQRKLAAGRRNRTEKLLKQNANVVDNSTTIKKTQADKKLDTADIDRKTIVSDQNKASLSSKESISAKNLYNDVVRSFRSPEQQKRMDNMSEKLAAAREKRRKELLKQIRNGTYFKNKM